MKLRSIETTPSPQCIKLNLDQPIATKPLTLSRNKDTSDAPQLALQLLDIQGVQEVFLNGDFITLTRNARVDWQPILAASAGIIGLTEETDAGQILDALPSPTNQSTTASQNFGQVEVAIQVFRGIPVQVRAIAADGRQARAALPDRFNQALQRAIEATQADYIGERRWQANPSDFGDPQEAAQRVADELVSLIDQQELARLEAAAIANPDPEVGQPSQQGLLSELRHSDWKRRLKALQQIEVTPETFSAVVECLADQRNALRRWATAILGGSQMSEAVEPLSQLVLCDRSAIVRRTAADALSDLGDENAIATMIQALADSSSLVRWRAARFLNELGDQTAIEPLRQAAAQEAEFDVRLEMQAAQARIEEGKATQLPMWMRISQDAGQKP